MPIQSRLHRDINLVKEHIDAMAGSEGSVGHVKKICPSGASSAKGSKSKARFVSLIVWENDLHLKLRSMSSWYICVVMEEDELLLADS